MDFFLDNSHRQVAAAEARHRGGSYELDDAQAELRRANDDANAARTAYTLRPCGILGADLDRANRRRIIAARRVSELGGEA